MIKTFEKIIKVQIDNTTLCRTIDLILDNITDYDLGDYISDSLDDESKDAFEKMRANDDYEVDNIIEYVKNAILEKFELEKE